MNTLQRLIAWKEQDLRRGFKITNFAQHKIVEVQLTDDNNPIASGQSENLEEAISDVLDVADLYFSKKTQREAAFASKAESLIEEVEEIEEDVA